MAGVLLGSVQFARREIPETVTWGGKQMLHIHKQLGGQRVIDTMGPDPRPIQWSGLFYGPSASARARAVDAMKDAGAKIILAWGSFTYQVVISEFHPEYKHEWEVKYQVTCEVVSSGPSVPGATLDSSIGADLATLVAMTTSPPGLSITATTIFPSAITTDVSTLSAAVTALASLQPTRQIQNATLASIQPLVTQAQVTAQAVITAQAAADGAMNQINLDALTSSSVQDGNAAFLAEMANQAAGSDLAIAAGYAGRLYSNLASAGG